MYEARKNSIGAPIGNDNASKQRIQNGYIEKQPSRIADQIADELGIGKGTVIRAAQFSSAFSSAK